MLCVILSTYFVPILNSFKQVISNHICGWTWMIEQKDVLTLQGKFWQVMDNVFGTRSNVSGNHTSITVVILDIVLEESLAFPSLLTNDPNNLPMGRLLNECQYFLLPWLQCGLFIYWHMLNLWLSIQLQSFLVFVHQRLLWQVLICMQKCWNCLPHFQLLSILPLSRSHFKHHGFHIRLGSLNGFFLAHSNVTSKVEWPPKHLGANSTAERFVGKVLFFVCVVTKYVDFQFLSSTVTFWTMTALETFLAMDRQVLWEIILSREWFVTYITNVHPCCRHRLCSSLHGRMRLPIPATLSIVKDEFSWCKGV